MKNMLLAGVTAVALTFGAMGAANAALSISGGTGGTIPGGSATNNALAPLGFVNNLGGYYGAHVSITAGTYLFEYLGTEGSATNTFNYTGGNGGATFTLSTPGVFTNAFNPAGIGAEPVRTLTAGALSFNFTTTQTGTVGGIQTVTNAGNATPVTNVLNFFSTFNQPAGSAAFGATSGDVLYLFFDDTGGPGGSDDDNHDDMVVRISAVAVPEPATLALFGAGLLGLGLVRRRRQG